MGESVELAKDIYIRVKRKLISLAVLDYVKVQEILDKNGFIGQFWSLKFDIEAACKNYPTLDASKLSNIEKSLNFQLPLSYKLYLREIANGGIGGWSSLIYPLSNDEIPQKDDLIVENFPNLEVHYSPTEIAELDLWEEKHLTGSGLILSQIDNGDDVFIVCKGNLPGSVWWRHCSESRYVPLAEDFLGFFNKELVTY